VSYFCRVGVILVIGATFAMVAPVARADSASGQLELRGSIDKQEYLPGEPVLLGLSVRNVGPSGFVDRSPIDPRQGYMQISATRDGMPLPWTGPHESWLFAFEGPELGPGEEVCDVFDLADYFGSRVQFTLGTKTYSFRHALPPGAYSLRISYQARLGARGLPPALLDAPEITLSIRDAAAIPSAEIDALDLTQPAGGTQRQGRWENLTTRRLDSSSYWLLIARAALPPSDDVEVDQAAERHAAMGRGLLGAAELRLKYERFYGKMSECEAWLKRADLKDRSGKYRCLRHTWQILIVQRRKYGEVDSE
jgi:hypothetical protein